MATEVDDFLAHFGVLGMHWGIRNDKKPGFRARHREAKAKKFDAKAAEIQKQIDAILAKQGGTNLARLMNRNAVNRLSEDKQRALSDAKAKREGKLSSGEKRAVKGAAAVGAILAAYGSYTLAQTGEGNRQFLKAKQFITKSKAPWNARPDLADNKLSENEIFSKVVQHINPEKNGIGSKTNCRRCTFAYEMRRRGFDVAATKTTNARGQHDGGLLNAVDRSAPRLPSSYGGANSLFKRASTGQSNSPKAQAIIKAVQTFNNTGEEKVKPSASGLMRALSKHPNGARGEIVALWDGGGGHSMAWEIVHGKPVIFDTQTGKKFSSVKSLMEVMANASEAGITRLDNRDLNTDFLMRWLKNA